MLSRDTTMPEAVREEAAREFVRLTMKDVKPASAPVVAPTPRSPVDTLAEMFAALDKREAEIRAARPKPADPESETQQFAHDQAQAKKEIEARGPEPIEMPAVKVWRNERGESEDQIKARMWREKVEASNAFYRTMGGREGEWPGV
jgi:hypothetical protein